MELAEELGPFGGYYKNAESTRRVLSMHRDALDDIGWPAPPRIVAAARREWDRAVDGAATFRGPQRSGVGPRPYGDHFVHDGLCYHRHRTGLVPS